MRFLTHARLGACTAFVFFSACQAIEPEGQPEPTESIEEVIPPTERDLPTGWKRLSSADLATQLQGLRTELPMVWTPQGVQDLMEALTVPIEDGATAEQAMRAALMLSLDASEHTEGRMALRLTKRLPAQARGYQACDILCARALGQRWDRSEASTKMLRELSVGAYPHPNLDTRIECARAYLNPLPKDRTSVPLEARPVLAFLLRVLRAETPSQRADAPDWERVETLAWSKTRAADTLSLWLEDPVEYVPDGPWSTQNAWATGAEQELRLR